MIRTKQRIRCCVIWLILNLTFIWGNSLLPGGISGALSNAVSDVISFLFPHLEGATSQQGRGLLRKLTHFAEFALLGMCLRWLFGMLKKKPTQYLLFPWLLGALAAVVDEGIQIFVPNRGPSLRDVGIDTAGLSLGIGIISIIHFIKYRRKTNHEKMDRICSGTNASSGSDSLHSSG